MPSIDAIEIHHFTQLVSIASVAPDRPGDSQSHQETSDGQYYNQDSLTQAVLDRLRQTPGPALQAS